MNGTTELVIVYAIVAAAALYALWRFVPGLKKQLGPRIAQALRALHLISPQREIVLAAKLGAASGCGSCDTCGVCGPKKVARETAK